eukprot:COSAG04_NODE_2609_length_3859_cov_13.516223_5_plen_30_part_00
MLGMLGREALQKLRKKSERERMRKLAKTM